MNASISFPCIVPIVVPWYHIIFYVFHDWILIFIRQWMTREARILSSRLVGVHLQILVTEREPGTAALLSRLWWLIERSSQAPEKADANSHVKSKIECTKACRLTGTPCSALATSLWRLLEGRRRHYWKQSTQSPDLRIQSKVASPIAQLARRCSIHRNLDFLLLGTSRPRTWVQSWKLDSTPPPQIFTTSMPGTTVKKTKKSKADSQDADTEANPKAAKVKKSKVRVRNREHECTLSSVGLTADFITTACT